MTSRKRILVPVKPNLNHSKAVDTAMEFAKELNAELHFISIVPKTVQVTQEEVIGGLAQKVNRCSENKIRATYELRSTETRDQVGGELARAAENFDLVVIGHTQYEQIYRFLHSSTAVDLLNRISLVPVIVVPSDEPQGKKA